MNIIGLFFAGAFLCNCIPHLASGLRGEPFPTPFAKPSGVGLSSPLLNVLWGFANAVVGGVLLGRNADALSGAMGWAIVAVGGLAIGIFTALHFGKVRAAAGSRVQ
jgi:hypothetical protein